MKAYKGFYKDEYGRMYCKPYSCDKFYYEEGKTYTLPEGKEPELCHTGFHACTNPIDVFEYYNSIYGNVEFHEVELEGVSCERTNDSKVAGRKITIGREITPDEMFDIGIGMMLEDKEKYFKDDAYIIIRKDTKYNYIGTDGKLLSETWFDWMRVFHEGFALVNKDGVYNYIDKEGKILSEEWFNWCGNFSEGFGVVNRFGKYNYIDKDGKFLSETWFYDAQSFHKGVAKVKTNRKWKYIDTEGKIK